MSPFSSQSPFIVRPNSNLQSFLSSVTPNVGSLALQQNGGGTSECFRLCDLWDCYEEWSAYGIGVPIVLSNSQSVTQYYVPYLSAIQIYTNTPQQISRKSESEKSIKAEDDIFVDGTTQSLRTERLGDLYFQFCDTCSPYWRIPFVEKIADLAEEHPGLITLKYVDLSPASWISVAWYPIYHIPMKGNCKDNLSTCFLTYHTLSSSSQGLNTEVVEKGKWNKTAELVRGGEEGIYGDSGNSLFPFGLVTYRLEEETWINSHSYDDCETIVDLYSAADSWLKQLNFWHHDFSFFTSQFNVEALHV